MVVLTSALSFFPKYRAASTAHPAFAPSANAIRIFTIALEAPIAVRAVCPAKRPAMIVSANVYNC